MVDGGPPSGDGSPDSNETTLDVEQTVSQAPGTTLYVYEFPNFDNVSNITDAYNTVVAQDKVDTLNSSYRLLSQVCERARGCKCRLEWGSKRIAT